MYYCLINFLNINLYKKIQHVLSAIIEDLNDFLNNLKFFSLLTLISTFFEKSRNLLYIKLIYSNNLSLGIFIFFFVIILIYYF